MLLFGISLRILQARYDRASTHFKKFHQILFTCSSCPEQSMQSLQLPNQNDNRQEVTGKLAAEYRHKTIHRERVVYCRFISKKNPHSMDRAYYDRYYRLERIHWWFNVRKKILLDAIQCLNLEDNPRALNVGAATGYSSEWLGNQFPQLTSLEYDEECRQFAEEKTSLKIDAGSICDLPYESSSFDLACAFDVIEHVRDDQVSVNELLRVVKPRGYVIATVPCYNSMWSHHDDINHHFRRYRLSGFKHLFRNATIMTATYFNTFLFLPIYLTRVISRACFSPTAFSQKNSKDHDPNNWFSKLAGSIFGLERTLLKKGYTFPFGVSALVIAKKR